MYMSPIRFFKPFESSVDMNGNLSHGGHLFVQIVLAGWHLTDRRRQARQRVANPSRRKSPKPYGTNGIFTNISLISLWQM